MGVPTPPGAMERRAPAKDMCGHGVGASCDGRGLPGRQRAPGSADHRGRNAMRALRVSRVGWWLGGLGLGLVVAAAPALAATVEVCHLPQGNPENVRRIQIPASALAAHLDHGDTLVEHDANCDGRIDDCPCDFSAAAALLLVTESGRPITETEMICTSVGPPADPTFALGVNCGQTACLPRMLIEENISCQNAPDGALCGECVLDGGGNPDLNQHIPYGKRSGVAAACVLAIQGVARYLDVACPAPPVFQE